MFIYILILVWKCSFAYTWVGSITLGVRGCSAAHCSPAVLDVMIVIGYSFVLFFVSSRVFAYTFIHGDVLLPLRGSLLLLLLLPLQLTFGQKPQMGLDWLGLAL